MFVFFIQELTASHNKDIRSRILNSMKLEPDIAWQKITEECQRMLNIKHDNFAIEEKDI